MQRNTHLSCFGDSHSDGHIWWEFEYFHLYSIFPNPSAGTRVYTHSRVHTHTHTLSAAHSSPSCSYPVDLSSLKNYQRRIYSFGRIPGTTFTFSSDEMGSRLCELRCHAARRALSIRRFCPFSFLLPFCFWVILSLLGKPYNRGWTFFSTTSISGGF